MGCINNFDPGDAQGKRCILKGVSFPLKAYLQKYYCNNLKNDISLGVIKCFYCIVFVAHKPNQVVHKPNICQHNHVLSFTWIQDVLLHIVCDSVHFGMYFVFF